MQREIVGPPGATGQRGAASTRSVGELLAECESSSDGDGAAAVDLDNVAPESWFEVESPASPGAECDAAGSGRGAGSRSLTMALPHHAPRPRRPQRWIRRAARRGKRKGGMGPGARARCQGVAKAPTFSSTFARRVPQTGAGTASTAAPRPDCKRPIGRICGEFERGCGSGAQFGGGRGGRGGSGPGRVRRLPRRGPCAHGWRRVRRRQRGRRRGRV